MKADNKWARQKEEGRKVGERAKEWNGEEGGQKGSRQEEREVEGSSPCIVVGERNLGIAEFWFLLFSEFQVSKD